MTASDGSQGPDASMIQITVTDVPSESYSMTCLLSDGLAAIEDILPAEDGTYQLTIAVRSEDDTYAGTAQWVFSIGQAQAGQTA